MVTIQWRASQNAREANAMQLADVARSGPISRPVDLGRSGATVERRKPSRSLPHCEAETGSRDSGDGGRVRRLALQSSKVGPADPRSCGQAFALAEPKCDGVEVEA